MSEYALRKRRRDARTLETALVVSVAQILDGDAACHCGAPAVLVVTSDPDGEPGAVCLEHAEHWIGLTLELVRRLFGPKVASAEPPS